MRHRFLVLCAVLCLCLAGVAAAETVGGTADGDLEMEGRSFWSRLEPEWYGYLKLDVSYDGSRTYPGEFAKWAAPAPADDEVTVTLNQTRLGLKLKAPGRETGFRAGGRVEVDFYGHVDDPDPRIRHAFLDFSWQEADFDIIVGQTSDVISPLYPSTLNYTVAWWAGNIGFRRPQIRLTKRFAAAGDAEWRVEGALTHNIYDTKVGSVSGEDSGLAAQARVAYSFPGAAGAPATVGVSGHSAEERFVTSASLREDPVGTVTERCDSWSANFDLSVPLSGSVRLQSELFTGKSLSPYLGGAGQGVDLGDVTPAPVPGDLHGIHSRGGWLALNVAPESESKWRPRFNLGVSLDDVDGEDLAPGARELNRSVFGNAILAFSKRMDVGLELSHWTTRYKDRDECDALRTQLSLIYKI